jgi:hypothetical protein
VLIPCAIDATLNSRPTPPVNSPSSFIAGPIPAKIRPPFRIADCAPEGSFEKSSATLPTHFATSEPILMSGGPIASPTFTAATWMSDQAALIL